LAISARIAASAWRADRTCTPLSARPRRPIVDSRLDYAPAHGNRHTGGIDK